MPAKTTANSSNKRGSSAKPGKPAKKSADSTSTPSQKVFVQEYLVDLNATRAAKSAGYSEKSASEQGSRLLGNIKIQKAIQRAMQQRAERTQVTQDRVVTELARIAFGDLSEVMSWSSSGLSLKDSAELTADQLASIAEISETSSEKSQSMRIKRHDKVRALEILARHLGMLNDKLNISGGLDITALEKGRERAKSKL